MAATESGIQGAGGIVLLAVIVLVITVRVYRSATRGIRFSTARIYRLPALYLLITIISIASITSLSQGLLLSAALLAAGLLAGLRMAGGVKFFEKNGAIYYKRSPLVMLIWLVSFFARFGMGYMYPSVHYATLAVALVLAATTGLIIGEASHIKKGYEAYKRSPGTKGT